MGDAGECEAGLRIVSVAMTEMSATGIRNRNAAIEAAVAFSEMYADTTFAVIEFVHEKCFDVEVAYPSDRVGAHGVQLLVRNGQAAEPGVG